MENKYSLTKAIAMVSAHEIIAYTRRCMTKENKSERDIKKYTANAMSSGYDHLVEVSLEMINKLNKE